MKLFREGNRERDDFGLKGDIGTYTEDALEAFLELAPKYTQGVWEESDRRSASELDGVCAFRTKIACLTYAPGGWDAETTIVEFRGDYVDDIPEPDGVLVRPTETLRAWTPAEIVESCKAEAAILVKGD